MGGYWLIALVALVSGMLSPAVRADEIVVTGQALVVNGDVGRARDEAMRRALGMATTTGSARVSTLTESRAGLVSDSTRVASTVCTQGSRILGETIVEDQLSLDRKSVV